MKNRPEIRLVEDADKSAKQALGHVRLKANLPVFDRTLQLNIEVPDRRVRLSGIVPLARSVCDKIVAAAVANAEAEGKTITCSKGCSACCCRYLVGMSEPEAFRLIEDIQALPGARRRQMLQGFLEMGQMAERTGIYEIINSRLAGKIDSQEGIELLKGWWSHKHLPCPILRADICSMYPLRPTACRQFVAVSDPSLCASKRPGLVRMPLTVYQALAQLAAKLEDTASGPRVVILPMLLRWYDGKRAGSGRTWRAPAMAERFVEILVDLAEKGSADGAPPSGQHLLAAPATAPEGK